MTSAEKIDGCFAVGFGHPSKEGLKRLAEDGSKLEADLQ
tara:strand:- start:141 stop:257 length:117 start_codon:yes stop_codon:yes gene_type:complete